MQVTIRRADLARVLFEFTSQHVEYVFGDSIRTIDESGDGLDTTFEGGRRHRFDLVVTLYVPPLSAATIASMKTAMPQNQA